MGVQRKRFRQRRSAPRMISRFVRQEERDDSFLNRLTIHTIECILKASVI